MSTESPNETREEVYERKFALLNQRMRWEVADELRHANLENVNARQELVVVTSSFYSRYGKRLLDIALASAAMVIAIPLIVATLMATALTLGRPLIFKQKRLGLHGRVFTLVKPRTMRDESDDEGRPLPGAMRLTRTGRLIRRTSLDELLNLWSVLKGDMSIIGPRPLVPEYADRYSLRHRQRMDARPGLNCPALTKGERINGYAEQFENDVQYVSNISLATDIRLLFRTVEDVFNRKDSRRRADSGRGSFMGYDSDGHVVSSPFVPMWALDRVLSRHGLLS